MGVAERRAREKDDLRRRILDTATALFVEQGYENVSMRKIADRIEYAPATIYLYFKDKVDIVASICYETFGELDRRLEAIGQLNLLPLETLRRSLRAYINFGLDHPSAYGFVFCTPPSTFASIDPETLDSIHAAAMQSFDRLRVGLRATMDSGAIAAGDLEVKAQTTWLFIHGVTTGLLFDCGFPFVDKDLLIEHAIGRVISSLN